MWVGCGVVGPRMPHECNNCVFNPPKIYIFPISMNKTVAFFKIKNPMKSNNNNKKQISRVT